MDHLASREKELEVDLESGGTTSEEDRNKDIVSQDRQTKRILNWVCSGILSFDGPVKGRCGVNLSSTSSKFGEATDENLELLINKISEEGNGEKLAPAEKKRVEWKRKKNSRKPPKPPLPPNGPSLDAADQKLVREIAELAMRKRARIERIKALKKMKAAKVSTMNSSLSAMIITLLFCLIIILQGLCSRSSISVSLQGSLSPAVTAGEGFISIQLYKNFSTHENKGPDSGSLSSSKGLISSSGS